MLGGGKGKGNACDAKAGADGAEEGSPQCFPVPCMRATEVASSEGNVVLGVLRNFDNAKAQTQDKDNCTRPDAVREFVNVKAHTQDKEGCVIPNSSCEFNKSKITLCEYTDFRFAHADFVPCS